jgi:zinc transport system ATP-binding protein
MHMTHEHPHTPGCDQDCILFRNVSLRVGSQTVLEDVSFSISCGEYVGVVGPNGGGKTTLLKLLLGLQAPTSGEILVYGKPPRESRKGGRIGYVPQRVTQQDLTFPATVEEIVQSGRTPRLGTAGLPGKTDRDAVEEALKMADIAHLRHRRIGELSGGERQRAFIARALAGEPHVLVLDEPTTGVDPGARDRFYAFLRDLHSNGLTILFVSHDVDVMTKEATTILCLNQRLLCHMPSSSFEHDANLQSLYGDTLSRIHHHH